MTTDEQTGLQALLQAHNYTSPASAAPATSSGGWYSKLAASKTTSTPPAPSLGDLDAEQLKGAGEKIVKSTVGAGENIAQDLGRFNSAGRTGLEKGSDIVGAAGHALEGGLGTAAGAVQGIFAPITAVLQKALQLDPLAANKNPNDKGSITGQEVNPEQETAVSNWAKAHPEAARNLMDAFTVGTAAFGGEAGIAGKEAASMTVTEGVNAAKQAGADVISKTGKVLDESYKSLPSLQVKNSIPQMVAEGKIPGIEGLGGQTKTSAGRLAQQAVPGGVGAAIKPKPIDVYDGFAAQEAKHIGDIKEDPAISVVGERIGDAFGDVVKQRQEAGTTMAAELKKTATKPVIIKDPLDKLNAELENNGVYLNRSEEKGLEVIPKSTSKFSSSDLKIINLYARELDKLGKNPTMAQVDAFVSRMPKEIEGLKATDNITFNTNAERIVGQNLDAIRKTLAKTGTKAYGAARSQYAELSQFVNEGAKYLGKITQSGDYAKDSSIAKSAVQSVLNNGKKDWLIELENKTGYPALDEAVLALQAMKDAGDFKGNSLLELLSQDAKLPTSPASLTKQILGFGGKLVGKAVAGSKAEQTRAFLKSLK